jgi:hypothetical protein
LRDLGAHAGKRVVVDRATFDQHDPLCHRMAVDRIAVMGADIDVHPDHLAFAHQFKQRSHEQDRPAPSPATRS